MCNMQISQATTTAPTLNRQAQRLHRAVSDLVRKYQFRDRNEIYCFGISVSQCYALEEIGQEGHLSMGALAGHMHLSVSTMTRVVDQLVEHGLVGRCYDENDRRVCCVEPTSRGRELLARISGELLASERAILSRIPAENRGSVISALEELSRAVDAWRDGGGTKGGRCNA
jgi:MarR family transcriptional regulator, 2-MHQ and catechol-resistance regulon repressor